MPSLEELVMAAQAGDRQAFATLVEMESARVIRITSAVLGSRSDGEDAAQEAFIRAWRDLPGLREPARWPAWIHRIAVRSSVDRARRSRRVTEVALVADGAVRSVDPAVAVAERDELRRALLRLPSDDRALLALRFAADLEMPDIAAALGVPLGTAKSRLHRALGRLRLALEEGRR